MKSEMYLLVRIVLGMIFTVLTLRSGVEYIRIWSATTINNWRDQTGKIFASAYLTTAFGLGILVAYDPAMFRVVGPCLGFNLIIAGLLTSSVTSSYINIERIQKRAARKAKEQYEEEFGERREPPLES